MAISERSMPFLISDALRGYSLDFQLLSTVNPFRFRLNGRTYSAHASRIHHAKRKNPDEWRIQVPRSVRQLQLSRQVAGDAILFLGFFPDEPVFAGWEAEYLGSFKSKDVGTIYVPRSDADIALAHRVAITVSPTKKLGRPTSKISLRSEYLGLYCENAAKLHASRSQNELTAAIATFADFIEQPTGVGTRETKVVLGGVREKIKSVRTAYPRDPKFRDDVLRAYGHACAVCRRQLGLIEAAHIVPHSHPDCLQAVTNGLALCVEHHRLYDDGLLLPTSGGRLVLNAARVEHLTNIGQKSGLKAIRDLAAKGYKVPDDVQSHPDDAFLERGVRIRLGTDA